MTTGSSVASERISDRVVDVRVPGLLLGVGLGGFVDGIVLHQILQWHHLLSSTDSDRAGLATYPVDTVAGLQANTLADGLFHAGSFVAVIAGLVLLTGRTSRGSRPWASRALWGWVLAGWGVFNLVEGLVNHHLLGIHHVRAGEHEALYDVGFLVFGALLVACGWLIQRSARVVGSAVHQ